MDIDGIIQLEVNWIEVKNVKAEIIAIGSEILLGDIVNTNAQYLSRELATLGIDVYHQQVVGDNEERLLKAYDEASL